MILFRNLPTRVENSLTTPLQNYKKMLNFRSDRQEQRLGVGKKKLNFYLLEEPAPFAVAKHCQEQLFLLLHLACEREGCVMEFRPVICIEMSFIAPRKA